MLEFYHFRSFSAKSRDISDPFKFLTLLTQSGWAFSMVAFYCEASHWIGEKFQSFNYKLQQCDWYLYPVKLQRVYMMFTLDTQELTIARGYGNIACTRTTFKTVCD